MKKYDVVIIGSGVGLMVLEEALNKGMKCAIVEKSKFGGTCLNKGCIPSKMLVYPADLIRETQKGEKVGLSFDDPIIDWNKISTRMWKQIAYNKIIEKKLEKSENLSIYKGIGEFTGLHTIKVLHKDGNYSEEFEGKKFIIAAGARSFIPPIKDLEKTGYVIPETFFEDKFPKKPWKNLVIIGGGTVGVEFAHIFSACGSKVTVIEMKSRILETEEEEISKFIEKQFKNNDIDIFTNTKIISVGKNKNNKIITVENIDSGIQETIKCEEIFIASGIRSNTDLLKIENTNVKTDSKGWIITNKFLETSQNNIWALGDINGKFQFRHKANYEAEILISNIFYNKDPKKEACYAAVPWAIFTLPHVAHVGLTEKEAENDGLRYWTGKNFYSHVVGGISMGYSKGDDDDGFIKIIVGENKKIIGVHIVGPYASILSQPFVYLLNSGHECEENVKSKANNKIKEIKELRVMCPPLGTYTPINNSMVIHPSLSELAAWVINKIDWGK